MSSYDDPDALDFEEEVDLRSLSTQRLTQLYHETRGSDTGVFVALRERVGENDPILGELSGLAQMVALAVRSLVAAGEPHDLAAVASFFGTEDIQAIIEARQEMAAAGWLPV